MAIHWTWLRGSHRLSWTCALLEWLLRNFEGDHVGLHWIREYLGTRYLSSSMDQQLTKIRVPRAILQGPQVTSHKDQPLQHLQLRLEDHHRLPQSLNQVQASRIHQNAMTPMDPPKHPQTARAQVLANQRRH